MCFYEAGLVVLAVPKTGTVALEKTLGRRADFYLEKVGQGKHMTYREFMATLEPQIRARAGRPLEIFAVMRAPLDWVGSWYRFRQRDHIQDIANSTKGISFEDFARTYCSPVRPPWADLPRQCDYIANEAGGFGPDRMFRYDDHASFVQALSQKLGYAVELPRMNVSPQGDLALSAPTLALLRDYCAEDLALYRQLADAGRG